MADPVGLALAGLRDGRVPNADQVLRVTRATVTDGPATGCRIIDIDACGGWSLRLLPDRGLDLGPASFAGVPVSWTSAVGPAEPLDGPSGEQWLTAFSGGLLTTCGLQNVGAPSEGHGLHGRYSHLRADEVVVCRTVGEDTAERASVEDPGEAAVVEISATIREVEALGAHLELRRTVRLDALADTIHLIDVTTNRGDAPVAAPLLYHVNLGAPLWFQDARLEVTAGGVQPRDGDSAAGVDVWDRPPEVAAGAAEWVLEHQPLTAVDGWAHAHVRSPATGLQVRLGWETATLPRLHQWSHRRAGVYALGIEPANCSTLGRAADREEGRLPQLQPDEARTTRLRLSAARLT